MPIFAFYEYKISQRNDEEADLFKDHVAEDGVQLKHYDSPIRTIFKDSVRQIRMDFSGKDSEEQPDPQDMVAVMRALARKSASTAAVTLNAEGEEVKLDELHDDLTNMANICLTQKWVGVVCHTGKKEILRKTKLLNHRFQARTLFPFPKYRPVRANASLLENRQRLHGYVQRLWHDKPSNGQKPNSVKWVRKASGASGHAHNPVHIEQIIHNFRLFPMFRVKLQK